MSYAIEMRFKKVENLEQAFTFALSSLQTISKEQVKEYLKRYNVLKIEDDYFTKIRKLHYALTFNFVYFKKQKLLGVLDRGRLFTSFPFEPFFFQNSSDRDYEYSEWLKLDGAYLKEVDSAVKAIGGDYDKKTDLYNQIFEDLDLDSFMWKEVDEKENFVKFSLALKNDSDGYIEFLK